MFQNTRLVHFRQINSQKYASLQSVALVWPLTIATHQLPIRALACISGSSENPRASISAINLRSRAYLTKCCILGSFVIAFSMDVLKSPFSRLRASFLQLISDDVSDSSSTCEVAESASARNLHSTCRGHTSAIVAPPVLISEARYASPPAMRITRDG